MKFSNSSQGNPQFGDRTDANASEVQPNHSVNTTATINGKFRMRSRKPG